MRPTHGIGIAAIVAGASGAVTAPAKRLPRRETALGVVFGLAWAASMRGMMAEVAATGGQSHVSAATFIFILLPGTLMGALMAWALVPLRSGMAPASERLKWARSSCASTLPPCRSCSRSSGRVGSPVAAAPRRAGCGSAYPAR